MRRSQSLPGVADVVVVGAGPAGCVVARRLAEAGAEVALLEEGDQPASSQAGLLDVGPGSHVVARYQAQLHGADVVLTRGRTLGGSGAVNGGYCSPMSPIELASWGPGWPNRYAVGLARAAERLRPRLVRPGPVAARVAEAFPGQMAAIAQARHGERRVTAFDAWDPRGAGVRVVTGAAVRELRWEGGRIGGRCEGVVLDDDEEIRARTVVLCAGAIGTAALLLASGIGPGTGHPVGSRTEEHPEVLLDWDREPAGESLLEPFPPLLSHVARFDLATSSVPAAIEVRPYAVPLHRVIPGLDPQPARIGVALMNPAGRGRVVPERGGGVRVVLDAHPDPWDTSALDEAVALVADRLGLARARVVSTSQHLSGSARIGEVVDDSGRVLGIEGIRVADASVFPTMPRRGPYYSVLAVAEDLAGRMVAERAW